MIMEVYSYVASFVEPIDLDEKKINDLTLENERLTKVNMSLNKKLDNHGLSLKDFNELKNNIISLEMNLKDSNNRVSILKKEIEHKDNSLASAKRLENMLKAKLSEHLTQEKKYEQWFAKSCEDVRKSDDILEKYAIKNKMISDKLDKANWWINKISSSSNLAVVYFARCWLSFNDIMLLKKIVVG